MPSELTPISYARLRKMKPKARENQHLFVINHVGAQEQVKHSPMWHVQDFAWIQKDDVPELVTNGDVRYLVQLLYDQYKIIKYPISIACPTGAHESVAVIKAIYEFEGRRFVTSAPGRPYLESVFLKLLKQRIP